MTQRCLCWPSSPVLWLRQSCGVGCCPSHPRSSQVSWFHIETLISRERYRVGRYDSSWPMSGDLPPVAEESGGTRNQVTRHLLTFVRQRNALPPRKHHATTRTRLDLRRHRTGRRLSRRIAGERGQLPSAVPAAASRTERPNKTQHERKVFPDRHGMATARCDHRGSSWSLCADPRFGPLPRGPFFFTTELREKQAFPCSVPVTGAC